jgi:ribonuclease BN (tRNA processing enzyme)
MPGVTVQIVGAGDAFGNGGRFQACVSVRAPEGHVLLDCGATSLVALKQQRLDPGSIDAVLVTHLHGDHFGGLPFLILDGQFSRRTRPLVVAGPPGLAARLTATMEALYPGSSTVERRFTVDVVELPERVETIVGPVRATAFAVDHASGAPSYALRVAVGGATIACSGDTAWTDALLDAAADADLFVCEAYTLERAVRYHLPYAAIRAHRDRLGYRRLLLTHASPDLLAHRADLDPGDELAEDGQLLTLEAESVQDHK